MSQMRYLDPADPEAPLREVWGPVPRPVDQLWQLNSSAELVLFALTCVLHLATICAAVGLGIGREAVPAQEDYFGCSGNISGLVGEEHVAAAAAAAVDMILSRALLAEAFLMAACLTFLATRRCSAALAMGVLGWHILQYTPAALASSSHPDALCDLVLRWELVAYGELSLSLDGYMWVLTLLPLLASCVLLSLLLVRLRVAKATEAMRIAELRLRSSSRESQLSVPSSTVRMKRAIRTSDALAAADFCSAVTACFTAAAPLLLPQLPSLRCEQSLYSPSHECPDGGRAGVGLSLALVLAYYPLLLLLNARLRGGFGGARRPMPFGRVAVAVALLAALGARASLLVLLPVTLLNVLSTVLQALSAAATLHMFRSVRAASRSQLRVLRNIRNGTFHPVPLRFQSVLRVKDASDIEALLRGCTAVRVDGVVVRRVPTRRERAAASCARVRARLGQSACGGWLLRVPARVGEALLSALGCLCCCCPTPVRATARAARSSLGRLLGGGRPAPRGGDSFHSSVDSEQGLGSSSEGRRRGAAKPSELSILPSSERQVLVQLSSDLATINICCPSGHRAGARLLRDGHEVMPFRLESASRVTSALATPGTTSPRVAISFRQSGQLPSFTALLEFSKPAEAAPWLALGRLLEAPPDVLPRRWRALYLRAFTASCSQPALGLVVPVELDAFLRRLNLDPQVVLSHEHDQRGAEQPPLSALVGFTRACSLLRPVARCRRLDDELKSLGQPPPRSLSKEAFLRLMRALRRPLGPADVRPDAAEADRRRRCEQGRRTLPDSDDESRRSLGSRYSGSGRFGSSRFSLLWERPEQHSETRVARGGSHENLFSSWSGLGRRRATTEQVKCSLGREEIDKIVKPGATEAEARGAIALEQILKKELVLAKGRSMSFTSHASGGSSDEELDESSKLSERTESVASRSGEASRSAERRERAGLAGMIGASLRSLVPPLSPAKPAAPRRQRSHDGAAAEIALADIAEAAPAPARPPTRVAPPRRQRSYDSVAGGLTSSLPLVVSRHRRQASDSDLCGSGGSEGHRGLAGSGTAPRRHQRQLSWNASLRRLGHPGGGTPPQLEVQLPGESLARRRSSELSASLPDGGRAQALFGAVTAIQSFRSRIRVSQLSPEQARGSDTGSALSAHGHRRARPRGQATAVARAGQEGDAEARAAFEAYATRVNGALRLSRDELLGVVSDPELNGAVHPRESAVWHDMTQPLSSYLIFTSHNTYLVGEQVVGLSLAAAYSRAIAMGCRCVELDCWDGGAPSYEPILTHGKTLTSNIKARDAIATIAAAYEALPPAARTPLVLSLEMHCTPPQQVKLAELFKAALGERLLPPGDGVLRSPLELMGRILLKGRVVPTTHPAFKGSSAAAALPPRPAAQGSSEDAAPAACDAHASVRQLSNVFAPQRSESGLSIGSLQRGESSSSNGTAAGSAAGSLQRADSKASVAGSLQRGESAGSVAASLPRDESRDSVVGPLQRGESAPVIGSLQRGESTSSVYSDYSVGTAACSNYSGTTADSPRHRDGSPERRAAAAGVGDGKRRPRRPRPRGASRVCSKASAALSYLSTAGRSAAGGGGSGSTVHSGRLSMVSFDDAAPVSRSFFVQLRSCDGARPQLWLHGERRAELAAGGQAAPPEGEQQEAGPRGDAKGGGLPETADALLSEVSAVGPLPSGPAAAVAAAAAAVEEQPELLEVTTQATASGRHLSVVYLDDAASGRAEENAEPAGGATASGSSAPRFLDAVGSKHCVFEAPSEAAAAEWAAVINDELWRSEQFKGLNRDRISPDLSEITHLASRKLAAAPGHTWQPTQMCSINEREATRLLRELDSEQIVSINRTRLCRVYPHYSRYASDNVEPELFANLSASGFQMVALNLQTPDDAFVYASALFSQNGGCGYLLAPPRSTGLALRVSLLSARHVPKVGEGRVAEPPPPWHGSVPRLDTKSEPPSGATEAADVYVTMQVIGPGFCCAVNRSVAEGPGEAADTDAVARLRGLQRCVWRSSTVLGNGFNAEWGVAHADEEGRAGAGGAPRAAAAEEAEVLASRPELSVLRVCVWSASSAPLSASNGVPAEWLAPSTLPSLKEVAQSSDTLLAYAAVPLLSLRGGVRALKMMHPRGEPIELCSVLCDISLADDAVPFDDLSGAGSTPPSALVPARSGKSLLRKFIMRRGTSSSTLSSCSGGAAVAPAAEA